MKRHLKIKIVSIVVLLLSGYWRSNLLAQASRQGEPITDDQIVVFSFAGMRYPRMAQVAHVRGLVVIRVKLDDAGKVLSSEAISGPKLLIADSLANAKKWRFQPNASRRAVIIYEFLIPEGMCDQDSSKQGYLFIFRKPNIASITACEEIVQP